MRRRRFGRFEPKAADTCYCSSQLQHLLQLVHHSRGEQPFSSQALQTKCEPTLNLGESAFFRPNFNVKMLAESTTFLSCSTLNATLTSARIRTPILCRQEPTVLAPSTMNFQVAAPPECRGSQMPLTSIEIVDFSRSTKCEQFSKCLRQIRYILSVAVARNVERLAPFTMKYICFF